MEFQFTYAIVIEFMTTGFTGMSPRPVRTFEIALTTSMPLLIFPNTGCFDCPPENQSRLA